MDLELLCHCVSCRLPFHSRIVWNRAVDALALRWERFHIRFKESFVIYTTKRNLPLPFPCKDLVFHRSTFSIELLLFWLDSQNLRIYGLDSWFSVVLPWRIYCKRCISCDGEKQMVSVESAAKVASIEVERERERERDSCLLSFHRLTSIDAWVHLLASWHACGDSYSSYLVSFGTQVQVLQLST